VDRREVLIEDRYCGPLDSGNGGYVCGLVAGILGGAAEINLRRPPPVSRPLLVRESGEGGVALLNGGEVVAEGLPRRVEVEAPEPVGLGDAVEAPGATPASPSIRSRIASSVGPSGPKATACGSSPAR
jgi:hypothetical protein